MKLFLLESWTMNHWIAWLLSRGWERRGYDEQLEDYPVNQNLNVQVQVPPFRATASPGHAGMALDRSGAHCAGTITILESLWRRWHSLLSILALPQEELAVRRGSVTRSWEEGVCGRQQTAERACVISGSLAPSVMAILAGWRGLLGYWHHWDLSKGYFPALQRSPLYGKDFHKVIAIIFLD